MASCCLEYVIYMWNIVHHHHSNTDCFGVEMIYRISLCLHRRLSMATDSAESMLIHSSAPLSINAVVGRALTSSSSPCSDLKVSYSRNSCPAVLNSAVDRWSLTCPLLLPISRSVCIWVWQGWLYPVRWRSHPPASVSWRSSVRPWHTDHCATPPNSLSQIRDFSNSLSQIRDFSRN